MNSMIKLPLWILAFSFTLASCDQIETWQASLAPQQQAPAEVALRATWDWQIFPISSELHLASLSGRVVLAQRSYVVPPETTGRIQLEPGITSGTALKAGDIWARLEQPSQALASNLRETRHVMLELQHALQNIANATNRL